MRIVSLLPAATEIVGVLGQLERLVGVSHECDFPPEVSAKPREEARRDSGKGQRLCRPQDALQRLGHRAIRT